MKISMKLFSTLALFGSLALTALAAQATGTVAAPNTVMLGNLSAPQSKNYGDSFFAPTSQTFYDDYTFTLSPAASLDSITASIDLGAFFGINNISARLYQGSGPFSPGTTPLMQAWSTPFNAAPGVTGSTTVISLPTLAADTYTLEIRGDVVGFAGGSYSGSMNVAPVPEPEMYAMLLAGLGLLAFAMRRKSTDV
ncbi:MAG: FxDxF family PEP-CTERM protein [Burkholderiaceae bacterium]